MISEQELVSPEVGSVVLDDWTVTDVRCIKFTGSDGVATTHTSVETVPISKTQSAIP